MKEQVCMQPLISIPEAYKENENKLKEDLVSISDASIWASNFLKREITNNNISYLIQYAKIRKFEYNGTIKVSLSELEKYYKAQSENGGNGNSGKSKGKSKDEDRDKTYDALNWTLAFDNYKESETTKHVHRLHPYKGKFIPQLVEYFLDNHIDDFKKEIYFKQGDIILDPFCGSGTTLVQANELSMHAIGVDVSIFNTLISNCKLRKVSIPKIEQYIRQITNILCEHYYLKNINIRNFENALNEQLNRFNQEYFPSYEYKISVRNKTIDEKQYSKEKEEEFLKTYYNLVEKYNIDLNCNDSSFINKWFLPDVRKELYLARDIIRTIDDTDTKNILTLILSRIMRSCRATTHSDLATLLEPVTSTYYCTKHYKICKPLFSIIKWWETYSKDTLKRLNEFDKLRTNTEQTCITGDSRDINLDEQLKIQNIRLYELLKNQKLSGIFSSPPYVGLIDYHEQHAYAYELFNLERKDDKEIGRLFNGQRIEARESYIEGISAVLLNCKRYLKEDYNVFLVANDKYNLYPKIAEKAGMKIVNEYKRPVLKRSEKVKNAYSETIFHLKENDEGI